MVATHFHIYPRKRGNSIIYYYRLKLQDKTWTHGKSTGQKTEEQAYMWVEENLNFKNQKKPESGKILFKDFARDFWKADSFYIVSRREFGHSITESHRNNRDNVTQNHLLPAWGKWTLGEMDTKSIKKWLVSYKREGYIRENADGTKKHVFLSAATMNNVRNTLSQIMDHAVAEGLIEKNPVKPIPRFHGDPKNRGVLSIDELKTLLDSRRINELWNDYKYYLITFTAAGTGLRMGEIRALTARCVGAGYIRVERGWDERAHNWKLPKWNKKRTTPAPRKVSDALLKWISDNDIPPGGWVFQGDGEHPLSDFIIRDNFYLAMQKIGIDENERRERNIVFHSLRHSVILAARKEKVDPWQLMKAVGHGDLKILDKYSDHAVEAAELKAVVEFQNGFFENDEI